MGTGVLVVDGCPTTRLGVDALLNGEEDIDVVGEADEPDAALRLAGELGPDVVVQDLELGEEATGGVRLCKELKGMPEAPRVLFHTSRNSHQDVYSCYLAGADGYVHKREEPHRLVDAVRQVLRGRRVWLLGATPEEVRPGSGSGSPHLTAKEQEVLALMLEGLTNRQISGSLCVGLQTVKTHVRGVYRKLGVSSRDELFAAHRVDGP